MGMIAIVSAIIGFVTTLIVCGICAIAGLDEDALSKAAIITFFIVFCIAACVIYVVMSRSASRDHEAKNYFASQNGKKVFDCLFCVMSLNDKKLSWLYKDVSKSRNGVIDLNKVSYCSINGTTTYDRFEQIKRDFGIAVVSGIFGSGVILGDPGDNCFSSIWIDFYACDGTNLQRVYLVENVKVPIDEKLRTMLITAEGQLKSFVNVR